MTTWNNTSDLNHESADDFDARRFERISRCRQTEWGVRSDASKTRARMRSRGGAAARLKARSFNGVNRRGRVKLLVASF